MVEFQFDFSICLNIHAHRRSNLCFHISICSITGLSYGEDLNMKSENASQLLKSLNVLCQDEKYRIVQIKIDSLPTFTNKWNISYLILQSENSPWISITKIKLLYYFSKFVWKLRIYQFDNHALLESLYLLK